MASAISSAVAGRPADRKEFREATKLAGENVLRIETQEAARKEAAPLRGHDFFVRGIEQSRPDTSTAKSERSDRDGVSIGLA